MTCIASTAVESRRYSVSASASVAWAVLVWVVIGVEVFVVCAGVAVIGELRVGSGVGERVGAVVVVVVV